MAKTKTRTGGRKAPVKKRTSTRTGKR